MGSFAGHVLPGAYFILFGTWLSWSWMYSHYAKTAANKRPKKYCKPDFLLGSLLLFLPLAGIFLEQFVDNGPKFSVMNATGSFQDINNWSHCSMYLYFMIYGCITVINSVKPTQLNTELRNLMMCISLFIEGFLFYYHLHAREMLEIRIHILLVYAIWSGALFSFLLVFVDKTPPPLKKDKKGLLGEDESSLEYMPLTTCHSNEQLIEADNNSTKSTFNNNNQQQMVVDLLHKLRSEIHTNNTAGGGGSDRQSLTFLLRMALATSLILQGTWFCQIATILYPVHGKPWDPEEHANTMFVAVSYSWHLIAVIICQFIFSSLFSKLLARK